MRALRIPKWVHLRELVQPSTKPFEDAPVPHGVESPWMYAGTNGLGRPHYAAVVAEDPPGTFKPP